MQTTSTARRLHVQPIWFALLLAAALVTIVVAGLALVPTPEEASVIPERRLTVIDLKTNENVRFVEINQLPETSPIRADPYESMRFIEINQLPGGARYLPPASDRMEVRH